MAKKLSQEAIQAIKDEVKCETERELNYRFKELEKNIIQNVSLSINDYLLQNSDYIVESSKKKYKKQIRNSVECILKGYKNLKDFVNSAEKIEYNCQINYRGNHIIRTF